ncbi:MAG: polysaccharide deacetylase family protein [Clostridia bacterium]|nr:polysaccharide deacetylase family protein [Clostridia bacterium]
MFNGKMKALTFSYDDGVDQDIRLIEIFNKYGLKATFNLNSELLGRREDTIPREGKIIKHYKVHASDVRSIYEGHEIAAHTLTHPLLPNIEDDNEIVRQVEQDRLNLSELAGYEVVGMAYPCGGQNYDDRVADLIRSRTGIQYCRTIVSSYKYDPQTDLYRFRPTVYHHADFDKMVEMGKQFLEMKTDTPKLFYIWGHAFEFDIAENWEKFEEFCKMMSGHDDIFYGTNKEVLL